MATNFVVVSDDQHKAFFNSGLICMFRIKKDGNGELAIPSEVEVEFIGGTKTRLYDKTADHFLSAMGKMMPH